MQLFQKPVQNREIPSLVIVVIFFIYLYHGDFDRRADFFASGLNLKIAEKYNWICTEGH